MTAAGTLPWSRDRRNGSKTTLFAAFDVETGLVIGECYRAKKLLSFLHSIDQCSDRISDKTTIYNFLRLAQRRGLPQAIFADVNAHLREKIQHPFHFIHLQFVHVATRYSNLAKNRTKLFMLFALVNLFRLRKLLTA